jgi:hypothetical protein
VGRYLFRPLGRRNCGAIRLVATTKDTSYQDTLVRYFRLLLMVTTLMILAGGAIVFAHAKSGIVFNAILAIQLGATAPLVFERIIQQTEPLAPGPSD